MSAGDPRSGEPPLPDGSGLRVGIVASRYNRAVTDRLAAGARGALIECGVSARDIETATVPGALEIPALARGLIERGGVDAIVAVGCVVRGETTHYETVAAGAAEGISRVAADTGVPVTNAILTTENLAQARARSGGGRGNAGRGAALAAVEVAAKLRALGRGG